MNWIDRCVGETLDRRDAKIAELTADKATLARLCCGVAIAGLALCVGAYFLGKARLATEVSCRAETSAKGEEQKLQAQGAPTWRERERNLYEEP